MQTGGKILGCKPENSFYRYSMRAFLTYALFAGIPILIAAFCLSMVSFAHIRKAENAHNTAQFEYAEGNLYDVVAQIKDYVQDVSEEAFFNELEASGEALRLLEKSFDGMVAQNPYITEIHAYAGESKRVLASSSMPLESIRVRAVEAIEEISAVHAALTWIHDGQGAAIAIETKPGDAALAGPLFLFCLDLDKLCGNNPNLVLYSMEANIIFNNTDHLTDQEILHWLQESTGQEGEAAAAHILKGRPVLRKTLPQAEVGLLMVFTEGLHKQLLTNQLAGAVLIILGAFALIALAAYLATSKQLGPIIKLDSQVIRVKDQTQIDKRLSSFQWIAEIFAELEEKNKYYESIIAANRSAYKDNFLRDIIWNYIADENELQNKLHSLDMDIVPKNYLAILTYFASFVSEEDFQSYLKFKTLTRELVTAKIGDAYQVYGSIFMKDRHVLTLVNIDYDEFTEESKQALSSFLMKLKEGMQDRLALPVKFIVGYPARTRSDLCKCVQIMQKMYVMQTISFTDSLLFLNADNGGIEDYPLYLQNNLENAIRLNDQGKIRDILETLFTLYQKGYMPEEIHYILVLTVGNALTNLINSQISLGSKDLQVLRLFYENLPEAELMNRLEEGLTALANKMHAKEKEIETNRYVYAAIEYMKANYSKDIAQADIAEYLNINTSHFSRIFKSVVGSTPLEFLTRIRMEQSKSLIEETQLTIKDIGEMVGYNDSRSFVKFFKRTYGCTPGEYRKNVPD